MKRHGTKRVLIAYDRDDAGNAAADKLAPELLEAGIECFRVLFPKGMDANDYAQKVQPASKSLGIVLQQAEWLGKGKRPGVTVIDHTPDEQSAAKEKKLPEPEPEPEPAMAASHFQAVVNRPGTACLPRVRSTNVWSPQ